MRVMPDEKAKLGYASSDETRFSDREGAGRYYRELPSMGTLVVIVAMGLAVLAYAAFVFVRRIFP